MLQIFTLCSYSSVLPVSISHLHLCSLVIQYSTRVLLSSFTSDNTNPICIMFFVSCLQLLCSFCWNKSVCQNDQHIVFLPCVIVIFCKEMILHLRGSIGPSLKGLLGDYNIIVMPGDHPPCSRFFKWFLEEPPTRTCGSLRHVDTFLQISQVQFHAQMYHKIFNIFVA